jgi:malonyl-CoA/methylmalonyl-CoA synthetase
VNLTDLFNFSFAGRRDQAALIWQDRTYTFGELDQRSDRMAGVLAARGLVAGDRLAVYLANCIEMIDLYLACVKQGVIFVPINILYREREIGHILADAEPKAIVARGEFPSAERAWQVDELGEAEPVRPNPALTGDTAATLVYTSGTTGASKGAILTHNNFAANAVNLLACWQIAAADRLLLPLPLFHVHGLGNGLHCWLISGCRMCLLERFEQHRAADYFRSFRPTVFFGVPTIYVRLLDLPPETAQGIGQGMRLFVSGSAPLPAQVLDDFRDRFGHVILERYGMTETLMNMSNPYAGERRAGTVGFPLPGISARLLTEEGAEVADGETGELYIRGPNVFAGYWRKEEITRGAFVDGYFRTGDLASRSPDGYYTLRGRRSDLIISGGFNIYPREIEEFLQELEGVAEAAVVGVPDRVRGEVPVAYIVAKGECRLEDLEAHCRASLASFKVPRKFVILEKLPRTALGKIQKHLLR